MRFLFSHSALREGWDNPNVFVICTLKHSDNTISRRQEVGRGMRLARNQSGDRMDDPAIVHQVNVLTVVANESYKDFVAGLQKDISASLSARPKQANEEYFKDKVLKTPTGDVKVTPQMAKLIERYLIKNDYSDADRTDHRAISRRPRRTARSLRLPPELQPYTEQVFQLIDSVFSAAQLPEIEDDRQGQAESAQRQLREEGISGALEPYQPQGDLRGRFRDLRVDREVHQDARQGTEGHAAAIHRDRWRAERRSDLRVDEEKGLIRRSRKRDREDDHLRELRREVRSDRQIG